MNIWRIPLRSPHTLPLLPAVIGALLAAATARGAEAPPPREAPAVSKVVLYKHGMGYIERQGAVRDTAVLQLTFRADQMKDLLTSFYAVDLGGGRITSVRYETKEPLAKQLQEILISVPEKAALSQFLAQLTGARVTLKAAGEGIEGRILGLEPTTESLEGRVLRQGFRLVILTDAGPIRSADLFSVAEFTLTDEALQRDLRRLLDLSLDGKHSNRKKLTLTDTGEGEREVRIGYLIEMPVWKASYRLILDPKAKESALLQGWAQAENTTEDDWNEVALSFVAGNPLSFVMDLYAPLYVKRPHVPIPGLQALAVDWGQTAPPEAVSPGRQTWAAAPSPAPLVGARRDAGAAAAANVAQTMDQMEMAGAAPAEESFGELLSASVGSAAAGVKVGELFSYEAQDRVSIPRGEAALVPIVSRPVRGRRVVYYKAAFSPKPTNAWVLRNDTDLTFEAGAVTFFEGSTSLGEGILAHTLPPGSQEVIPYALDASVDVSRQAAPSRQPYFQGKIADGVLTLARRENLVTAWKLTNRGKEEVTLWLNQPKSPPYRLSKPEKPLKEVDEHYRFEIVLKPGETRDFTVEEQRDIQELVEIGNAEETKLRFFAAEEYLNPATRAFLADLAGLQAKKASRQRQIAEWQEQTRRLSEEEERLRQNIGRTNYNTPGEQQLRAKWMGSLAAAEEKLTALRGAIDDNAGRVRELEEELARKIREFKGD